MKLKDLFKHWPEEYQEQLVFYRQYVEKRQRDLSRMSESLVRKGTRRKKESKPKIALTPNQIEKLKALGIEI